MSPVRVLLTITALYLAVGVYGYAGQMKNLSPSEIGDFLAGAFSPLAFMWLIFGYFQQGKELRNNSDALERQIDEMRQTNLAHQQQMAIQERTIALQAGIEERRHAQYLADHAPLLMATVTRRGENDLTIRFENVGADAAVIQLSHQFRPGGIASRQSTIFQTSVRKDDGFDMEITHDRPAQDLFVSTRSVTADSITSQQRFYIVETAVMPDGRDVSRTSPAQDQINV